MLSFVPVLLLVCAVGLVACGPGSGRPALPPIEGQVQLLPDVLPEEGGDVEVSWSAAELGVWLTNELGTESDVSPLWTHWTGADAGQSVHWRLRHASREVTGGQTLHVRPRWQDPPALLWQSDSPVRQLWPLPQGSIWLLGETRQALTGAHQGGVDIWALQHGADGRLSLQRQWGDLPDDQWRGVLWLQNQAWVLARQLQADAMDWQVWPALAGPQQGRRVACAQGLQDVLHILPLQGSEEAWLLLGLTEDLPGTGGSTRAGETAQVVVRHCVAWDRVLSEVAWPRSAEVNSGFLVHGSTVDAAMLALNSRGDVGAGSAGSVNTVTLAHVDMRKGVRQRVVRVDTGTSGSLAGGRLSLANDRVDWWGQRTAPQRSATGDALLQAWVLQTSGPVHGTALQIRRTWLSDETQLATEAWVWAAPAAVPDSTSQDQDDELHLLAVGRLFGLDGPAEWVAEGHHTMHWLQIDARGVHVAQTLPWLMHGLSGRVAVSAAAQDPSGDWLLVTESEHNGQRRLQLDRFRQDGRGRGRADLTRLQQTQTE